MDFRQNPLLEGEGILTRNPSDGFRNLPPCFATLNNKGDPAKYHWCQMFFYRVMKHRYPFWSATLCEFTQTPLIDWKCWSRRSQACRNNVFSIDQLSCISNHHQELPNWIKFIAKFDDQSMQTDHNIPHTTLFLREAPITFLWPTRSQRPAAACGRGRGLSVRPNQKISQKWTAWNGIKN